MEYFIPSMTPSITNLEIDYVTDAAQNGWGDKRTGYLDKLSIKLSELTGVNYCIPVSHGTAGLQLALHILNVGPGDEVIVPDLTWVASAAPIVHLGATPVFVDVDETMCMDVISLTESITSNTKAIVVVDLVGSAPKWDNVLEIARLHQIPIVEDATESIGSKYKSKDIGTFGDFSVFSFNATKLTMSGQGGAICTNSLNHSSRIKALMAHGIDISKSGKYYWSNELGYNFQLSNLQAAMAFAQLERIQELMDFKNKSRNWYLDAFEGTALNIVPYANEIKSNSWMNVGIIDPKLKINKEKAISYFKSAGIDLRPFFYRLSDMPTFGQYGRAYKLQEKSFSHQLERFGICLPYGYNLNITEVEYIAHVFKLMCKEVV